MPKVVIACVRREDRSTVEELLGSSWDVEPLERLEELLQRVDSLSADAILLGTGLSGTNAGDVVTRLRQERPGLPVVLLAAEGPDEHIQRALRLGAASYVSRAHLAESLAPTLERILSLSRRRERGGGSADSTRSWSAKFTLPGEPTLFTAMTQYLLDEMEPYGLYRAEEKASIGVAIDEALLNAWIHGNLEIGPRERERGFQAYESLIKERRNLSPYRERTVTVEASFGANEGRIEIEDEGYGFDVESVPDPTLPENATRPSGRGLFLMRCFFDDVRFNEIGNRVTLIKRPPEER